MNSDSQVLLAYCTFPDEATATKICETLVADGTIACANIFSPHRSIYKWNDQLENHSECCALLKLAARCSEKLKEKIRAEHPYENPALMFLQPTDGLPEFLKWIDSQCLY